MLNAKIRSPDPADGVKEVIPRKPTEENMNNSEEIAKLLQESIKCGKVLISCIEFLMQTAEKAVDAISGDAPLPAEETTSDAPPVTYVDVRGKLAALCAAGKKTEGLKILAKYDASKLSELKEEYYGQVMKEAEELIHE